MLQLFFWHGSCSLWLANSVSWQATASTKWFVLGLICPSWADIWAGSSQDNSRPIIFCSICASPRRKQPCSVTVERVACPTSVPCPLLTLINSTSGLLSFRIFWRQFRHWCICSTNSKGLFHPVLLWSSSSTWATESLYRFEWGKESTFPETPWGGKAKLRTLSHFKEIFTPQHHWSNSSLLLCIG